MRKVKLNDLCEFPPTIDLFPYTKEGLASSNSDDDEAARMWYKLVGILVHSGTADSGHYYSYVKEQCGPQQEAQWIHFNDIHTEYFDPRDIGRSCFGGTEAVHQYDQAQQKPVQFWQAKQHSAYMLFYERFDVDEENPVHKKDGFDDIPSGIAQKCWEENEAFAFDRYVFEPDYDVFMRRLLQPLFENTTESSKEHMMPVDLDSTNWIADAVPIAVGYVVDCLCRYKDKETLRKWSQDLQKTLAGSKSASHWLLNECVRAPGVWPRQVLLECGMTEPRFILSQLMTAAVQSVMLDDAKIGYIEDSQHAETETKARSPMNRDDESFLADRGGVALSSVARFIDTLFDFVDEICPNCNYENVFEVIWNFVQSGGVQERKFLLRRRAISRLCDFYLREDSPMLAEKVHPRAKKTRVEDRTSLGNLSAMFEVLASLVTSCSTGSEKTEGRTIAQLEPLDTEMVSCAPFYALAFKENMNPYAMSRIITHVCFDNVECSRRVADAIIRGLDQLNCEFFKPYFSAMNALLELDDSYRSKRINELLSSYVQMVYENRHFRNATTHAIRHLSNVVRSTASSGMTATWLSLHLDEWLPDWLLKIPFEIVRQETAILVESILECRKDDLSTCQTVYTAIYELLSVASVIATTIGEEDTGKTNGKIASYLQILRLCYRHEESATPTAGSARFMRYMDGLIEVLLALRGSGLELDDSATHVYCIFSDVLNDEKVALEFSRDQARVQALLDANLRTDGSSAVTQFNDRFVPVYFDTLHKLCARAPSAVDCVVHHRNAASAVTNFVLHRDSNQGFHDKVVKFLLLCVASSEVFRRQQLRAMLTKLSCGERYWVLQFLNHIVSGYNEGSYLAGEGGVPVLERLYIEIGEGTTQLNAEEIKEMSLCANIICRVAVECEKMQGQDLLGSHLQMILASKNLLASGSIQPNTAFVVLRMCLFYCTNVDATRELCQGLLEAVLPGCPSPKPAVSPASESREILEHLSVRDENGKEFTREDLPELTSQALPSFMQDANVMIQILSVLCHFATVDAKMVDYRVARVIAFMLREGIKFESDHRKFAALVRDLFRSTSPGCVAYKEQLGLEANLRSYPAEVLRVALPKGLLLVADDTVELVAEICSEFKIEGTIENSICSSQGLSASISCCCEFLEQLAVLRSTNPSNDEQRQVDERDLALHVVNFLGAVLLGALASASYPGFREALTKSDVLRRVEQECGSDALRGKNEDAAAFIQARLRRIEQSLFKENP